MRFVFVVLTIGISLSVFANPPQKIKFIENKNQWSSQVHYMARVPGGSMEVRGGSFSYYFLDYETVDKLHHGTHGKKDFSESVDDPLIDGVHVSVNFLSSNTQVTPRGIARSKEYYNFFQGSDKTKWGSEAYGYDGFLYPELYNGVDLKVYAQGANLKYDLIVSPGADPSNIKISYDGVDEFYLSNGDLVAKTKFGAITEKDPIAFQFVNGKKVFVPCEFQLDGKTLSFFFPSGFDPCCELVIDPLLIFSTYAGSTADSWGSTATPAENGQMYSSGVVNHFVTRFVDNQPQQIYSGTFPATAGAFQTSYGGFWDIGILKYDSLGREIIYASYLGGSEAEFPHSLVVNKNNELIILGTTSSVDFPVSENAHQKFLADTEAAPTITHVIQYNNGSDLFLTRISADGKQLLASSYVGSTGVDGLNITNSELINNYGDQLRGDVITDDDGFIYVSSVTASQDLPAINSYGGGITDAIVMKLPPELNEISWLRYVGGTGTDAAYTIKLDSDNNLYAAGGTASTDLLMAGSSFQSNNAGGTDGWIVQLSNDGQNILHSTYSGSSGTDQIYFLDLNATGDIYVYGQTNGDRPISSPDIYGVTGGGQFIQKFSSDLGSQYFYTVFGTGKGSPDLSPTAFLVNNCNNIYLAGWGGTLNTYFNTLPFAFETSTTDLEVTQDAYQKTTHGHDFYFLVLSEDAKERLYATFLGGTTLTHVDGGTSRFDKSGVVYHAVCASCGSGGDDFPTTENVVSRTNNSLNCNNAAFKFDLSSLKALGKLKGSDHVCVPAEVEFENYSIGGESFFWNFGDGTPVITQTEPGGVSHTYLKPGTFTVWLKAYDPGTCRTSDSVAIKVYVELSQAEFPEDASICEGGSHTFSASGGVSYQWVSKDGSFSSDSPSITVSPEDSTLFYISVAEPLGCVSTDSVWLNVTPKVQPEFEYQRYADCSEDMPKLEVKNLTDSLWATDHTYFDFGDGTTSDLPVAEHVYEKTGNYVVKVVVEREGCVFEEVAPLWFGPLKYPNVITPGLKDAKNDAFMVQYGDDPDDSPNKYGFQVDVVIYDRWGRKVYEKEDYQSDWTGADLSTGIYYYQVSVQDHATCKGWVHLIK